LFRSLGNRVIKTVANINGVFGADLRESEKQNDRFVVDHAIEIFERHTAIPGSQHQRLKGKIQAEIHLVKITLMPVLDSRCNTSLRIPRVHAASEYTRLHIEFEPAMER